MSRFSRHWYEHVLGLDKEQIRMLDESYRKFLPESKWISANIMAIITYVCLSISFMFLFFLLLTKVPLIFYAPAIIEIVVIILAFTTLLHIAHRLAVLVFSARVVVFEKYNIFCTLKVMTDIFVLFIAFKALKYNIIFSIVLIVIQTIGNFRVFNITKKSVVDVDTIQQINSLSITITGVSIAIFFLLAYFSELFKIIYFILFVY